MPYRKTILLVDDSAVTCEFLYNILKDDYEILQAKNGRQALDIVKVQPDRISLIFLDLVMPVMDGYEFLNVRQKDEVLSKIPVIVGTAMDSEDDEIRSLENGASDFVKKPYKAEIVKHRVASIIRLRDTAAMLNSLEYDQLTGLCSREFFYQHVKEILERYPKKNFDLICSDIENFKMINERYGSDVGDELLKCIASQFKNENWDSSSCARLSADIFAILTEHREIYTEKDFVRDIEACRSRFPNIKFNIKFGIYSKVDRELPVSGMCDRAILSLNRIKRQYGQVFSVYDDKLQFARLKEQQILDCMEQALSERQFMVYYQPKYDIRTETIVGAEALVRWSHPEYGFMMPGDFIPLFERNGFIAKLDYYVWEEVCKAMQEWNKKGNVTFPISVNVSRIDFQSPDLVEKLVDLVERYDIDNSLLHLEITESAYTENPQEIIESVKELRNLDFKIEMDDFGSGYSSLNMFSELPLDILKLDMGFIQHQNSHHAKSILSFMISLSKWMGLESVAEGVESQEQVDSLKNMGCNYAQGYFYAKPMPKKEFEVCCSAARKNVLQGAGTSEIPKRLDDYHSAQYEQTVLIVEDIDMNRDILRMMLVPYYNVVEAENGQMAYEFLQKHGDSVSVILLDLMMPIMDGFQFLETIRTDKKLSEIPVIITSERGSNSELQALSLGADSFVGKPYQREIIMHHIKSAIDGLELRRIKSELEERQITLTQEANRDSLTGLFNRRGLGEAVSHLLGEGGNAVFMLDIDNLKRCNDTFGHSCGDSMIETVTRILTTNTRDDDILARVGGDEFVIIMQQISDAKEALKKGNYICSCIKSCISPRSDCSPSCSAGVTIMRDLNKFDEACDHADQALYRAKRENKGNCCLWEGEMKKHGMGKEA